MRHTKSIAVTLAVVFALALIPQSLFADATPSGSEIFAKKCAMCHGKDGSKNLPNLATASEADYAKTIENGKAPKMPAYKGKLTADEINQVAKYIKSLKK